ncbi:hypothetical protein C8D88_11193 [Lentzea atacamensis]|uniref:Uncharacterized protein n=1 Tax=Lentzea atacamensis TaxID=531938 RepID=A0A316HPP5_9PSEU|nr:hypothetical protein [Lentzea atacamensis]PWK83208.1 hypothetical protein C8D88_11193 [Lentzea atacamensis]
MSNKDDTGREYGAYYGRTRLMSLTELTECMYRVITRSADSVTVPTGTEFALWHNGEQNIVVKVMNLTDEFLFIAPGLYTCEAEELHNSVEDFFEKFNWTHPGDGLDRRFFCTVHLLSEAQQRAHDHQPGLFFSAAKS